MARQKPNNQIQTASARQNGAADGIKPALQAGVWTLVLLVLSLNGLVFIVLRYAFGLRLVTNLTNLYAWGIWKAVGVASLVAIAAGGFTIAALTDVFRLSVFNPIRRAALLLAMLGYTFAVIGLFIDLGRYYNIWHPVLPSMWSGHSALFEVAICIMSYLIVLYLEFFPVLAEKYRGNLQLPGFLARWNLLGNQLIALADRTMKKLIGSIVIIGVVLSCMHQSALGTLMLIAGEKMNPLWFTPILPLLFLLSAVAAGIPSVVFFLLLTAKSLQWRVNRASLSLMTRYAIGPVSIYLAAKILDLSVRDQLSALISGSNASLLLMFELLLGGVVPLVIMLNRNWIHTMPGLWISTALIVGGTVLNRINVYLTAFNPPHKTIPYFPSTGELSVTAGLIAMLLLLFRYLISHFRMMSSLKTSVYMFWVLASGTYIAGAQITPDQITCSTCHYCPVPTNEQPCLFPCPRDRLSKDPKQTQPPRIETPDRIILNSLEKLYEPVVFDHSLHSRMSVMSRGCSECHHHTSPGEYPVCQTCHPVELPATTGLNLKGAYHRQCLFCHKELDQATTCEACHALKSSPHGPVGTPPTDSTPARPTFRSGSDSTRPFPEDNTRDQQKSEN